MQINKERLKSLIENKLIIKKESKNYPGLFVLKYSRKVFYDNLWHVDPLLLEARGLVVDANDNIVIKPFTKVFNYGENGTTIDDNAFCMYVMKINGFLGVVTYDPSAANQFIYSTTGSLDSDFVDLIKKHVQPHEDLIRRKLQLLRKDNKFTLMFEICDESDPHIINEKQGAWLIGCNSYSNNSEEHIELHEGMLDDLAMDSFMLRPDWGYASFNAIKNMANGCRHEGFMVQQVSGGVYTKLKIKSPYYLITKFLARAGDGKITMILEGNIKDVLQRYDEEYYPLIHKIREDGELFKNLDEQQRIAYVSEFLRNK